MRFVQIETDDQLDLQGLHRVRDRLITRRTSVLNQLRAFLLEGGLVFAKSPAKLCLRSLRTPKKISLRGCVTCSLCFGTSGRILSSRWSI
jgi:hypothetical protein